MLTDIEKASEAVGELYEALIHEMHYPGQHCEICQDVRPITERGMCDDCWVEIQFRAGEGA